METRDDGLDGLLIRAWASLFRHTPNYLFIKNTQLIYVGASEAFARMTGAGCAENVIGRTDVDLFTPELAARYNADDLRVIGTGEPMNEYVEPLPDEDGRARRVSTSKYPVCGPDGAVIGLLGIGIKIEERDDAVRLELEARRMAQPETVAVAVADLQDWRVLSFRSVHNKPILENGDSVARLFEAAAVHAADGEARAWLTRMADPIVARAELRKRDALEYDYLRVPPGETEPRYTRLHMRLCRAQSGGRHTLLFLLCDVHGQVMRERALIHRADTDGITGFYNHDATLRMIDDALASPDQNNLALIMIDIDGFKTVNDRLGHLYGDAALANIADAIRACSEPGDVLGRVGGDEFLLLMKNAHTRDAALARALALNRALTFECSSQGERVPLTASLGIAMAGGAQSAGTLYHQADLALYRAKREGKNRAVFFDEADFMAPPSMGASPAACADETLRFERERYMLAVRQMGGMVWEVDIPRGELQYTEEMAAAFGISQTVFNRRMDASFDDERVHPDWMAEYNRLFQNIYAGIEDGRYTLRMRMADGQYHFLRVSFSLMRDDRGMPVRAIGVSEPVHGVERDMLAYSRERSFEQAFGALGVLYMEVNLTRNRVETCRAPGGIGMDDASGVAYDTLLRRLRVRTDPPGALSRTSLEAAFAADQKHIWIALEGLSDYGAYSAQLHVLLTRQPVCGDLHAYITARRDDDLARDLSARRDARTALCVPGDFALIPRVMVSRLEPNTLLGLCVARLTGLTARDPAADTTRVRVARLISMLIEKDEAACALPDGDFAILRPAASEAEQAEYGASLRARVAEIMAVAEDAPRAVMALGYAVEHAQTAQYDMLLHRARMACEAASRWAESPVAGYLNAAELSPAPMVEETRPVLLIVDDDAIARYILRELLRPHYDVLEAEDGEAALDILSKQSGVSLILLDLIMPRMDGWQVLQRLRDMGEAAPGIIVVTADSDTENIVRALDNGALDIIGKPYQPRIISSRVRSALSRAAAQRAMQKNREFEMRVAQQAQMLRLAEMDEVTGLMNRQAFWRAINARLREARPGERFILLRADIDRFKVLNDLYGTEEGDRFLHDTGRWLTERLRGDTLLSRLERDHFACFAPAEAIDLEAIALQYGDWLRNQRPPLKIFGSMGAYCAAEPFVTPVQMCDRALLALRTVKSGYATRAAMYTEDMRASLLDEQQLTGEIEAALAGGQFKQYYQPQYDMVSGRIVGAEALVRWAHPSRGLVLPGVFIPLCERNGFILRLDEYVWRGACAFLKKRLDARAFSVPIAVNLSRRDFIDGQLAETLTALVREYGLPVEALRLEITETAYMDNPEELLDTVLLLRRNGFLLEMDDFGSGYSSLNTLKNVPVDMLKLDMRFLESAESASRGGIILDAVVRMARSLGLPLIAEGVETQAQADYLISIGCTLAQGYLFGRPMPEAEFEALLNAAAKAEQAADEVKP